MVCRTALEVYWQIGEDILRERALADAIEQVTCTDALEVGTSRVRAGRVSRLGQMKNALVGGCYICWMF